MSIAPGSKNDESGGDRGGAREPNTAWLRSSFCSMDSCVEVSRVDGQVLVRDSKVDDGPVLTYTANEWTAFIAGVKASEFDL